MSRRMASIGTGVIMIWFFQKTSTIRSSKTTRSFHNGHFCAQLLKEKSKKYDICLKYSGYTKCKEINREKNLSTPNKSYKNKFCDNMIRNGVWDVLYLKYPCNQGKKWDLCLNQYRFPLYDIKLQVKILKKGYTLDKYMVQNLTKPEVYMKRTFQLLFFTRSLTMGYSKPQSLCMIF